MPELYEDDNAQIGILGTLCDDPEGLTCSFDAARRWGRAREIRAFPSFEAAAESVKSGQTNACLVPAAYPSINPLIMDSDLTVVHVFRMKIPSLVLAAKNSGNHSKISTLIYHPAVRPLLNEVSASFEDTLEVSSNSIACVRLQESKLPSLCITNLLCADHFRLTIIQSLREGLIMPWICFSARASRRGSSPTHSVHSV
jgi:hypothetical protein